MAPKHLPSPACSTCPTCKTLEFGWDVSFADDLLFISAPRRGAAREDKGCKTAAHGLTGAVFAYNFTNLDEAPKMLVPHGLGPKVSKTGFGESMLAATGFLFVTAPLQAENQLVQKLGVLQAFRLTDIAAAPKLLYPSKPDDAVGGFGSLANDYHSVLEPGASNKNSIIPRQKDGGWIGSSMSTHQMYSPTVVHVGNFILVAHCAQKVQGLANAGAIYAYDLSAGSLEAKLWTSTEPQLNGEYGKSLAVVPGTADLVLVGASKGPAELLNPKDGTRRILHTFQAAKSLSVRAYSSALFGVFDGVRVSIVVGKIGLNVTAAKMAIQSLDIINKTNPVVIAEEDCSRLWQSYGFMSSMADWEVDPRGRASAETTTILANDKQAVFELQIMKKEKWMLCEEHGCTPWVKLRLEEQRGKAKGVLTKNMICAKAKVANSQTGDQAAHEGCCVNKVLSFHNSTPISTAAMTKLYSIPLKCY